MPNSNSNSVLKITHKFLFKFSSRDVLWGLLGLSLFGTAPAFAEFESYPTDTNSSQFTEDHCAGLMNRMKFKVGSHGPQIKNSCLLFAIASGDRKLAREMLDFGASPFSKWVSNVKDIYGAVWPNPDGSIPEDPTKRPIIAQYIQSIVERSMQEAGIANYDSAIVGMGFSALTLAIEKNDLSTFQALIEKEPTVLNAIADPMGRCPLPYAILLKRKQMIQSFIASKSGFYCNQYVSPELKKLMASVGNSSILHRSQPEYDEVGANKPLTAAYISGDIDLALKILDLQKNTLRNRDVPLFRSDEMAQIIALVVTREDFTFIQKTVQQERDLAQYALFASAISLNVKFLETARRAGYDFQDRSELSPQQKAIANFIYEKPIDGILIESARGFAATTEKLAAYFTSIIEAGIFDPNSMIQRASELALLDKSKRLYFEYSLSNDKSLILFDALITIAQVYKNEISLETRKNLARAILKMKSDTNGPSPHGSIGLIQKMIQTGTLDIKTLDSMGAYSLLAHKECYNPANVTSSGEWANLLMSLGLDPATPDDKGTTGLTAIVTCGTIKDGDKIFIQALQKAQSCKDCEGRPLNLFEPLQMAIQIGHFNFANQIESEALLTPDEVVRLAFQIVTNPNHSSQDVIRFLTKLIVRGLPIETVRDREGNSLLMAAASERCDPSLVEFLIQQKINVTWVNKKGLTAADLSYMHIDEVFRRNTDCDTRSHKEMQSTCMNTFYMLQNQGSRLSIPWNLRAYCKETRNLTRF